MSWSRAILVLCALCSAHGCSGEKRLEQEPSATVTEPGGAGADTDVETTGETSGAEAPAIDERTGLVRAENFGVIVAQCTGCHSGRLVAQNRGTRSDWDERLRWMQANHNLWELPEETRNIILDYLAENYGVDDDQARHRRRRPLPDHLMPPTATELAAQPSEPSP